MNQVNCPLCNSGDLSPQFEIGTRVYWGCGFCDLLFALPDCLLSWEEEKARYGRHNNSPDDPCYVNHLRRLTEQLIPELSKGARGLDFGCGHTPVLSRLLENDGFQMENYDPFFGPSLPTPACRYDFVTCSETAEHFGAPLVAFTLIQSLLNPGGLVAVMTILRDPGRLDASWWYLRDPTHRCFYSTKTFEMLGSILSWNLASCKDNVVIFRA